jgi:hypothetical protein
MVRVFLSVTAALALFSLPALAGQSAPTRPRTTTFEPCNYWQYDFQTNTNTCRSTGFRVTVYSASEVQTLIGSLERRIADLEGRLAAVEKKLP